MPFFNFFNWRRSPAVNIPGFVRISFRMILSFITIVTAILLLGVGPKTETSLSPKPASTANAPGNVRAGALEALLGGDGVRCDPLGYDSDEDSFGPLAYSLYPFHLSLDDNSHVIFHMMADDATFNASEADFLVRSDLVEDRPQLRLFPATTVGRPELGDAIVCAIPAGNPWVGFVIATRVLGSPTAQLHRVEWLENEALTALRSTASLDVPYPTMKVISGPTLDI